MNNQAFNGPIKLCQSFQHVQCDKRFDMLCTIRISPDKKGTIGFWKWYIYNNVLHIEELH